MAEKCDREGTFRANITGYGLRDADGSNSVAVTLQARLLEMWDGQEWQEWEQYDMEAIGDIWIIKKDGSPNTHGVESLVRHAGWDGSIEAIVNTTWQPAKCQVVIKPDEYKGEVRYRIEFVNSYDRVPGQVSTVSPEKGRDLASRHGAALRAIAANVKRNATVPANGKPAAPAGAKPTPSVKMTEDSIPF